MWRTSLRTPPCFWSSDLRMLAARDDRGKTHRSTELTCPRNTVVVLPSPRRPPLDCRRHSHRPALGQHRNLRRTRRRAASRRRRCLGMFREVRRGGPGPTKHHLLHCRYRDRLLDDHCLSRSDRSGALRWVLPSLGWARNSLNRMPFSLRVTQHAADAQGGFQRQLRDPRLDFLHRAGDARPVAVAKRQ